MREQESDCGDQKDRRREHQGHGGGPETAGRGEGHSVVVHEVCRSGRADGGCCRGAADGARETIKVAQAARASDEHDRKVRQLRDIGQLAESLFWKAVRDAEKKPTLHGWRMMEHNYLEQALVGMAETLPKTVELTQVNFPDAAIGAARDARVEIVQALEKLKASAP